MQKDLLNKIREDPLLAIKQREKQSIDRRSLKYHNASTAAITATKSLRSIINRPQSSAASSSSVRHRRERSRSPSYSRTDTDRSYRSYEKQHRESNDRYHDRDRYNDDYRRDDRRERYKSSSRDYN